MLIHVIMFTRCMYVGSALLSFLAPSCDLFRKPNIQVLYFIVLPLDWAHSLLKCRTINTYFSGVFFNDSYKVDYRQPPTPYRLPEILLPSFCVNSPNCPVRSRADRLQTRVPLRDVPRRFLDLQSVKTRSDGRVLQRRLHGAVLF